MAFRWFLRKIGVCLAVSGACLLLHAQVQSKKDGLTVAGDVLQVVLPLKTSINEYQKDKQGWQVYTKALAATWVETQALKFSINAPRPNGGNRSFPSGHTSLVFSAPSYQILRYGGGQTAALDFALASFVGWSRMYGRYHHTRDVLAGATLAFVNQYLFLHSRSWLKRHRMY